MAVVGRIKLNLTARIAKRQNRKCGQDPITVEQLVPKLVSDKGLSDVIYRTGVIRLVQKAEKGSYISKTLPIFFLDEPIISIPLNNTAFLLDKRCPKLTDHN